MSEDEIKGKRGRPKSTTPNKKAVTVYLSIEAVSNLPLIAAELGLSQASTVELSLRDLAKARGVKWQKPKA